MLLAEDIVFTELSLFWKPGQVGEFKDGRGKVEQKAKILGESGGSSGIV